MQFIVETGEGLPNSVSYSSVEAADDYATFWDYTEWLKLTTEEKEKQLVKATSLLDIYLDYPSQILKQTQALGYPRKLYVDRDGRQITGIPSVLEEATIRLARMIQEGFSVNTNRKALTSQSYGNSSESYAGSYIEDYSELDKEFAHLIEQLSAAGVAYKSLKQIKLVRG